MQTDNALALQAAKDFEVTTDQLYKAWTSPEALKSWWHPMGNNLAEVKNDLNKGGDIKYVFQAADGQHSFTITGNYEEVKENQLLVYTWNWQLPTNAVSDSDFRLRVSFITAGKGSRLEVVQENFKDEEALHPHREGWEKSLNDLHQYLSDQRK